MTDSPTDKLLDDCFVHEKKRLRHGEALAILKQRVAPVAGRETVPVAEAAGRILAEPVIAPRPVPAHTNAAVDGYSFAMADYDPGAGSELPLAGRAAAGHHMVHPPVPGTAARIFTGAVMPAGHDTVVMQEEAATRTDRGLGVVAIPPGLKPGANVRRAGEDLEAGATVLEAGAVLRAQDLGALASVGMDRVACYARLKVALVSSGDEVVRPGSPLAEGNVFDANAPMLQALTASASAVPTDLGVLPDDPAETRRRLADAARRFDAIIVTGGASHGEKDHLVAALDAIGKRHLWEVAIKPGRPIAFGQIGDCVVLGLPGNPVAVFVCFLLYGWPLLRRMGGAAWPEPRRYRLPALFAVRGSKAGRREFWRGILAETPHGLAVDKFVRDSSGLISSLRAAHGMIEIPEDVGDVLPGDLVAFIPFSDFGIIG
jgi:molybdopterin molybdotransferase